MRTRSPFVNSACPLLACLLLAGVPAAAQDPPVAGFEEDIAVTEVLLDVLVTDGKGNAIIGLDKDDFVVEENGEPVDLQSSTFYSSFRLESPAEAMEKGLDVDSTPRERFFILFFHDQRLRTSDARGVLTRQLDAARQSQRWVREEMMLGDRVAVVSYDFKLKIHEDFSQDKEALIAAIRRASRGVEEGNWPSRIDEDRPYSLRTRLPTGKELRDATKTIYDGLRELAEASGSIQGRKNLLLFTLGFGDIDSFGQYQPDPRYYPPMARALNDNNVAIYGIDLAPPEVRHTMESAMNHLALDTGGEYLSNFTSFIKPLRRVSESTSGYYLLSYKARHPAGSDGYQKVEVRTRSDEFKVKAREGYLFGS